MLAFNYPSIPSILLATSPNCTFFNQLINSIVRLVALDIPPAGKVGAKPPVAIVKFKIAKLFIKFSRLFPLINGNN